MRRNEFSGKRAIGTAMAAVTAGVLALAGASGAATATAITVDEIIFANATVTAPANLSGTVNMTVSGDVLTITVTNTSIAGASPEVSDMLLTGIGFNLGQGMDIVGGSAAIAALSGPVNFTDSLSGDISGEWGFRNEGTAGPFYNPLITTSMVNTVVATLQAATDTKFSNTPIKNPAVLSGPDFGLLSTGNSAGGLAAVKDSAVFTLTLNSNNLGSLLTNIEAGDVVLSFGSPNPTSFHTTIVPEPATLLVFAFGLFGLAAVLRWRRGREAAQR